MVNCRVGSLEKGKLAGIATLLVNCRVGSLEIGRIAEMLNGSVYCRVGSLEYIDIVQNKCWIFLP